MDKCTNVLPPVLCGTEGVSAFCRENNLWRNITMQHAIGKRTSLHLVKNSPYPLPCIRKRLYRASERERWECSPRREVFSSAATARVPSPSACRRWIDGASLAGWRTPDSPAFRLKSIRLPQRIMFSFDRKIRGGMLMFTWFPTAHFSVAPRLRARNREIVQNPRERRPRPTA